MAEKQSQRFQVHVSRGSGNRGSKLATVLFVLAVAAIGGTGYYFWSMQDALVQHVRDRDALAVPSAWALHLKGSPPEDAYDTLLAAAEEGSPSLRRPAILALGHYRRRTLVAPIMGLLKSDPDPAVRAAAATCLGLNGNTVNPLLLGIVSDALEDPDSRVRAAAATTVGDLRYGTLIPTLIGMLDDHDAGVKKAAKRALETFTEGDLTFDYNRRQWNAWYAETY